MLLFVIELTRFMEIILENIGKNYNDYHIFSNINRHLKNGDFLAVKGPNGSGKSTLLKIISGYLSLTEGEIFYFIDEKKINVNDIYKYVSIAAPYSGLIEDFSVNEMLNFHFKFKNIINNFSIKNIIGNTFLSKYLTTKVKYCSSGIRQRLKLAIAIYSDTPLLLLDEPLINLDEKGIEWYTNSMKSLFPKRIIVVCSNNNQQETFFCNQFIELNGD